MPMTDAPTQSSTRDAAAPAWTCPFCPLLCDGFGVDRSTAPWRLVGSDCPRALRGLAHFGGSPALAQPRVDGRGATLEAAVGAAADILAQSRQPLFGGLGTDVAGARALYRLACTTGAISDAAGGAALMHALRALQDRGQFTTTLAEVRTRADVIVCLGASPTPRYPEFFRRVGIGEAHVAQRHIAFVGAEVDAALRSTARTSSESIALEEDLYATTALLAALVARRAVANAPPALAALAERLRAARYGVVVLDSAGLPAHGALIYELVERLVASLNIDTRAAMLPLAGADGASTVNQVFAWLSGLPLRSRAGALGLEHEPVTFDAGRLLADGAVDALLWVSSYGPEPAPPPSDLPRVVLAHPSTVLPAGAQPSVFIPVSTPGIGSAGHVFRTDGVVLMPLAAIYEETLPSAAQVLERLNAALRAERRAAPKPAVRRRDSSPGRTASTLTPSGDRPMYSSDEGLS
jgi:formylmethanofuran dehydrogenase subunit B